MQRRRRGSGSVGVQMCPGTCRGGGAGGEREEDSEEEEPDEVEGRGEGLGGEEGDSAERAQQAGSIYLPAQARTESPPTESPEEEHTPCQDQTSQAASADSAADLTGLERFQGLKRLQLAAQYSISVLGVAQRARR